MKKVALYTTVVLLFFMSFHVDAQITATNIKIFIKSDQYAYADARIALQMYQTGDIIYNTPFNDYINLATNVEHVIGTINFPGASMWLPPLQPLYWCRVVGGARAGSYEAGGVGEWGSPDGSTYTFDGGTIKITLPY